MLKKDMLSEADAVDPDLNKNKAGASADQGYNYEEHSIVFRIQVNANDLKDFTKDLTTVDGVSVGKVTLTDTLPANWEFQKISGDQDYLIYEGTSGSGGKVTAGNSPVDLSFLSADFTVPGTAEFTFTKLDKPYVILVKAGPTSGTIVEYFQKNDTYNLINTAALSAENWKPGTTAQQQITITSKILGKTLSAGTGQEQGVLTWQVEYKPNEIAHPGAYIEDTLPTGIELRTDATGNLILDGNISATELILEADGNYSDGDQVSLTLGSNIFYDISTRVLKFIVPDPQKAYRLSYKTDVTGETGTTLTNSVKLTSGTANQDDVNAIYTVVAADVSATMTRSGWLEITKYDENYDSLSGTEFTLFTADGATAVRTGITDSNGKLTLRGLPEGSYMLQETTAPSGYTLHAKTYEVVVSKGEGGKLVTSINEQTGADSNKIAIANFKTGTVGNLTIMKTIEGNAADPEQEFNFTVTVEDLIDYTFNYIGTGDTADETITLDYIGAGGKADGAIILDAKGSGMFTLKGGESITILNLPKDVTYHVIEDDYQVEGYLTEKTGDSGAIVADQTQTAAFVNIKSIEEPEIHQTGSLRIGKTVAGVAGDLSKEFDFTVTFGETADAYPYTGVGLSGGTIKSGDTISLAHGQSIIITGLPAGTSYSVTEADYTDAGYSVKATNASGNIVGHSVVTAHFTNTKEAEMIGSDQSKPATGDDTATALWLSIAFVSLCGIAMIVRYRNKHNIR